MGTFRTSKKEEYGSPAALLLFGYLTLNVQSNPAQAGHYCSNRV
jgi:hypothetical protein